MKAKSRVSGCRSSFSSGGLARPPLARGAGSASRKISNASAGASTSMRLQRARMDFAEIRDRPSGPSFSAPVRPGRQCAGASAEGLQRGDGRADGFEDRQHVALHVEDVGLRRGAPVARRARAPDGGERALLAGVVGVGVGGAGFEQARVVEAAIGVLLRGDEQLRQRGGAHAIEIGRDRVGDEHVFAAAAERLRLRARAEAPGDGFVVAERGGGAARDARAAFADAGRRRAEARRARRIEHRHFVVALDARDFFDEIGGAFDIAPPGRRLDDDALRALALRRWSRSRAPSARRARAWASHRCRRVGARDRDRRRSAFGGGGRSPATMISLGSPPQRSRIMRVASSRPGTTKPESTPRAKRYCASVMRPRARPVWCVMRGIEIGALDQDVGGVFADAGMFAADDAAEAQHARVVGDDAHGGRDVVDVAVERLEALAFAAHAGAQRAVEFGRVIDVQRAARGRG